MPFLSNKLKGFFAQSPKNRRNQDIIIYSRSFGQGVTYYVEENRLGRRELAANAFVMPGLTRHHTNDGMKTKERILLSTNPTKSNK